MLAETGTIIFFLVTSFWTPDGEFKVYGGGQFTQVECEQMKRAEEHAKADMPGLLVKCEHGTPKPPGLPTKQPHLPRRMGGDA